MNKSSGQNKFAGVAQLVEQLICNQQVGGSSPSTSSTQFNMGEFQSGQMGQTVNLLLRLRWFESTLSHLPSQYARVFFYPNGSIRKCT